ncbi:MAG: IS701 family transposase, partial [Psychromonas sp.]|nr:IS701 family transposase [Psychromonas sp.]
IESDDLVLIFDDTVQAKPFSNVNELISWHFDHTVGRANKGINKLNCIYYSGQSRIPVSFELITKEIKYSRLVTHKLKRKSYTTKNEDLIFIIKACKKTN